MKKFKVGVMVILIGIAIFAIAMIFNSYSQTKQVYSKEITNTKNEVNVAEEENLNSKEEINKNKNVLNEENGTNTTTENKAEESTETKKEEKTITKKKSNKGVIYLTFDDGPSSTITPKLLDILKENDVKATFFILNYNSEGEKLVKREYEEGHTVAIHGYSHDYNTIYKSEEAYMENLTKLQKKIKKTTGYTSTITRFPGGSSNTISSFNPGIMSRLTKLVVKKGFKYFDWNVSSGDAGGAKTGEKMFKNVKRQLSKKQGNVVLMHDFSSNQKVLDAVPKVIKYAKSHGYTFDRITEDVPMVTHGTNN